MNVFKSFGLASFEGAEFPWKTYEVIGGIRDHVHEYPHTPGGDPEKLGRKLYEIRFSPIMQADLLPQRYSRLFPERLMTLRRMFEDQLSGELVIPHIGPIQAYAVSWTEKADATNLSGVEVEWLFREDGSGQFGETFVLLRNNLNARFSDWTIEADALPNRPSIFDRINDAAIQVLSIKDQLDMYGALAAAKVEGLAGLIREADSQLVELQDPDNYPLLAALHDLMAATVELGKDIAGKGKGLQLYTTPMQMSVTQVAVALYGDTTRAAEIMQLNALDNPLAIPGGTPVVYYAD